LLALPAMLLVQGMLFSQAGAADASPGAFSPGGQTYRAMPASDCLAGKVGEKITLSFTLDPPQLPQGVFLSVNMKMRNAPVTSGKNSKPDVLTGFPETRMVFHFPGIYRYTVIVSMMAKSSCGGVTADTIFKGAVDIQVSPPDPR